MVVIGRETGLARLDRRARSSQTRRPEHEQRKDKQGPDEEHDEHGRAAAKEATGVARSVQVGHGVRWIVGVREALQIITVGRLRLSKHAYEPDHRLVLTHERVEHVLTVIFTAGIFGHLDN